jgi:formylglycine-generating enzyme required for sulfatase activity
MRRAVALSLPVVLLCCWALNGGAGKQKFEDPTPRKDAILKRFADEFVALTPGQGKFPASFMMGSDKGGAEDERPAHAVTFKSPFAVCKYEVTQELYHVIMGNNPSKWQGPRNSVEQITWADAVEFCKRATAELRQRKLIGAGEQVRLPSEAEWEYACRAGTTTAYSFGDRLEDLGEFAWYKKNAPGNDPPVGVKKPNPWGLYDMHGYVSEWCLDTEHPSYQGAPADGSAWVDEKVTDKTRRVIRGGSFADEPAVLRCAARQFVPADTRSDKLGFRCVKDGK